MKLTAVQKNDIVRRVRACRYQTQAEALKSSRWVGSDFDESARAMHYGEAGHEPIHGQATADEARELLKLFGFPFPVEEADEKAAA